MKDHEIEKIQHLRDSICITGECPFSDEKEVCGPGVRHDPVEIMQRNAAFLLESSKKRAGYDEQILFRMQQAFDSKNYSEIVDLAYQHDRVQRLDTSTSQFAPISSRLGRVQQFVANILNVLSN